MKNLSHRVSHFCEYLYTDKRSAWVWLVLRLYLASIWLEAGYAKFMSPAWIGESAGAGMTGFVAGALGKMAGEHPEVLSWYGWFLTHCVATAPVLWSYLITFGELAVGLGILFGVLTGYAALGGLLMNFNFILAGISGINPVMVLLEIPLVVGRKVAGTIGLEKTLLALLRKSPFWRS